jgi:very-short-patch-repair endonuclease
MKMVTAKIRVVDTTTMVHRAREVHGDIYDYSESKYVKNNLEIKIICKIHGVFNQKPINHISGKSGCIECGKIKTTLTAIKYKGIKLETLVARIELLNASPTTIPSPFSSKTTLTLRCAHHGLFKKTVRQLFHGVAVRACPNCSLENRSGLRRNTIDEVKRVLCAVYGDRYSFPYIDSEYRNSHSKITGICKIHGEFKSEYNGQVSSSIGCPKCKGAAASIRLGKDFDEWVEECNIKYGNRYDYSKVDWDSRHTSGVIISCEKHGEFSQKWKDHSVGCAVGCPRCANAFSSGEEELAAYISSIYTGAIERNWRGLLTSNLEADIYLPKLNLAFEYNGLHYHSSRTRHSNYHRDKRRKFNNEGIRVIQIWEDEFNSNKEAIKGYIRNVLGVNIERIAARKCGIVLVDSYVASTFLNDNHLLGSGGNSSMYVGLEYEKNIVSLMAFKKGYSGWELQRMVNKLNTSVVGGFSRMLTYWRRLNPTEDLVSYIDLDKFEGGTYYKVGFKYVTENKTMWYLYKGKRVSKFKFRRNKLSILLGDKFNPGLTEKVNCANNGIYQIWNSGTVTLLLPKYT